VPIKAAQHIDRPCQDHALSLNIDPLSHTNQPRGYSPACAPITRAMEFAAHKHTDQKRKGVRAVPCINHLVEVARLLADATSGEDPALVAAGLLHDTLEVPTPRLRN
jgi:(p)ppGpp synthase/HD superfamily hydrolase